MKYTYKQFSRITNKTVRTLRYYESIGLVQPIILENKRYLEEPFFMKIQTIDLLKKAGYTLYEIKDILENKNIEEQLIMQQDLLNIELTNIKAMLDLIEEIKVEPHNDIRNICEEFNKIQNTKYIQLQFEKSDGLKQRIEFHHTHTTFDINFHEWMFPHYQFPPKALVLEIGCGVGTLWKCNEPNIPKDIEIILTDKSTLMLQECKKNLHHIKQIKAFHQADCFALPYPCNSFDIVIINHVLMYFEDVSSALKEIYRILKKGGTIYCTTIGSDMMKERDQMLKKFDKRISFDQEIIYKRFGLENGKQKLQQYYKDVQSFERKEIYNITDLDLYFKFMLSGNGLSQNLAVLYKKQKQLYNYMGKYLNRNGVFHLTSHLGMFSGKKGENNYE